MCDFEILLLKKDVLLILHIEKILSLTLFSGHLELIQDGSKL